MLKILFCLLALTGIASLQVAGGSVVAVLLLVALAAVPLTTGAIATLPEFFMDGLSGPLVVLTLILVPLMVLASPRSSTVRLPLFLGACISLEVMLVVAFSVSQAMTFYVAFEGAILPAGLLILGWGVQPERLPASMYLALYTVGASLPLLVVLLELGDANGHLSFFLPLWEGVLGIPASMWWGLLMLPFLVKMPMYGFHLWLPKAHVEAPVAGSMALAGLLLKLGSFGLLRFAGVLPFVEGSACSMVGGAALWGGCLASFVCLRQVDLKALVAYSSVAHMSMVLAGVLSFSYWGWEGALVLSLAHGLSSSLLFVLVGVTYGRTGTRSILLSRGLLSVSPMLAWAWSGGLFANMGVPPSLNLQGELLLIGGSLAAYPVAAFVLSGLLVLAAGYTFHLYGSVVHGRSLKGGSMSAAEPLTGRENLLILLHLGPAGGLFLASDHFLWLV